ncbi:MAG: reverse transcriptase domain-containing protein [Patescibacteria group bacterium]
MFERVIKNVWSAWIFLSKHPEKDTKGIDGISINDFSSFATKGVKDIRQKLRTDTYRFSKLKPTPIPKGIGQFREILVGTISDRIVTRAILNVITPRFKKYFSGCDYSLRIKKSEPRGIPQAVAKIQEKFRSGYVWVFETDIKDFFGSVSKVEILKIMKSEIKNPKLFSLVEQIVHFQVENTTKENGYSEEEGLAQGSSISPLLASIYLSKFDQLIMSVDNVELIRYVDDLVVLCKSKTSAESIHAKIECELGNLGLKIHPLDSEKTRIIKSVDERFNFLGLSFNYCDVDISPKKKDKIEKDFIDIVSSTKMNFPEKRQKLSRKLDGLIDQYNKTHYKATDSLVSLCLTANKRLHGCFVKGLTTIIGYNPFRKLNPTQLHRLEMFFDLDLTSKIKKIKGIKRAT